MPRPGAVRVPALLALVALVAVGPRDALTGTSLPFVIADFRVTGRVTDEEPPAFVVEKTSRPVASGYPLAGTVASFR